MAKSTLICLLTALTLAAFPRDMRGQDDDLKFIQSAFAFVSEGKPLAAIDAIETASLDQELTSQYLAMLYSFVGEWEKVHQLQNRRRQRNVVDAPPEATFQPAIDEIVAQARKRQLVIINEAHDLPEHRLFILEFARRLRKAGFEYYAIETLQEDPEVLQSRGYPVLSTGFYSLEPVYGELIRQTLKLGYTPVAYESIPEEPASDPIDGINTREKGQADNLIKRVLSKNPDAKLLVHVGFDHAMESPRKAGKKEILWLAARLKKRTGIDPLTIDQTTGLKDSSALPEKPVVLVKPTGELVVGGRFQGAVDIQVFHPPTRSIDGRPDYLVRDEERVTVALPDEIPTDSEKLLVQAFYADESDDAVPADQFVITRGKPRAAFVLKPGRYRIVAQDARGNEMCRTKLSVPAAKCH